MRKKFVFFFILTNIIMSVEEIKKDLLKNIEILKNMYKCTTKYTIKEESGFTSTWVRSQLGNTDDNRQMEI